MLSIAPPLSSLPSPPLSCYNILYICLSPPLPLSHSFFPSLIYWRCFFRGIQRVEPMTHPFVTKDRTTVQREAPSNPRPRCLPILYWSSVRGLCCNPETFRRLALHTPHVPLSLHSQMDLIYYDNDQWYRIRRILLWCSQIHKDNS